MKTKKMLVPIDLEKPEKNINDFLFPYKVDSGYHFKGIKSGKLWKNGVVSYIGIEITYKEIFAKIVDSGIRIENVAELLEVLEEYIKQIRSLPLGNVTKIYDERDIFKIESLGRKPRINRNTKLP